MATTTTQTPGRKNATVASGPKQATTDGIQPPWTVATIVDRWEEGGEAIGLRLQATGMPAHLPGQHLELRLTSEDGYQAVRSYSVATPPDGTDYLELGIQVLPDGEVSGYLGSYARPGMQLEVRLSGARYFSWTPDNTTPTMLIAGGSGVVPLVSIWRAHHHAKSTIPMMLLYSLRHPGSLMYDEEWLQPGTHLSYTQEAPANWNGYTRRVDETMIRDTVGVSQQFYICGPTPFVEAVSTILVNMGYDQNAIRTERFGPTGGQFATKNQ
jgi:ferredoxin-NADP reductase